MSQEKDNTPLGIKILGWYGIIFGLMYVIVGIVNIVLSILDRTYKDMGQNFIVGLYGVPILIFSTAFKDLKKWGWTGYSILLAGVIIMSILNHKDAYGTVVGALSLVVLAGLFLPAIRKHYFAS
ncbi:membrane hypothetical protein [Candidatus Zixiibacteriota bacterium]|nr:membrane hypothetical protein [candidate division Zixibacteria bacterium]